MNHLRRDQAGAAQSRKVAGRLIAACLREDGTNEPELDNPALNDAAAALLIELANYHGVAGSVYERLRSVPGVTPTILEPLHERYAAAVRNHVRVLWDLHRLQPIIDAAGVPWAVVKGPAVVDLLYRAVGRRTYQDLDLLVDPIGFRDILMALQQSGSRLLDRNWRMMRREMRGQLHLILPGGTPLDLHWDLINDHRRRMSIDTREILSRADRVDLGGVVVPTPDPTDSLIHLAVHASVSGGDKLVWLKDLERSIVVRPPSWDEVVDRSRKWNVTSPVGLLLSRCQSVLGARVPAWVLRQLLGRQLARIARYVDRMSPVEQSLGGPTPGRLFARTIGHGVVGGSLLILERGLAHLDPREPEASSPFTPAGNGRDQAAFLRAVGGPEAGHPRRTPA
jgi:hypothetical protein